METNKDYQPLDKLKVWHLAMDLAVDYYPMIRSINDIDLKRQLFRSTLSIQSNIAEGFGRQYNREFTRFLKIAIGSLYEVQSQFIFADKIGAVKVDMKELLARITVIRKMIFALISSLDGK